MPNVQVRYESPRGCGYRKPGGMYLVGGSDARPCCKLPAALSVCPCCGEGIKQARGFTWISSDLFFPPSCDQDTGCCLAWKGLRMGLMWVGAKYYPSPTEFTREAAAQGISKRIAQIPRELVVGKTWIALAHPAAIGKIVEHKVKSFPGVFAVFRPSAIEYVVTGKETDKQLADMESRGITLVDIVKISDTQTRLTI